jgi:hypothetical protein
LLNPGGRGGDRDKRPKVPVTFLGVDTSPVPPVVCEQMNLAKGFGLVVDYVAPDGPAAAAGVQQNDILKLLNDQILMEPSQLAKLIRSYSDGTTVTLTVLRKGQEQKISVKLGKKEVPKGHEYGARGGHDWMGDHDFGMMGEEMRNMGENSGGMTDEMIQNAVENARETAQAVAEQAREQAQQQREMAQQHRDAAQRVREQAQRIREQAQEARNRARDEAKRVTDQIKITTANGLKSTRIDLGRAQVVFSDDKGELRLEQRDGKKMLTAKDPQGKLLFSGPVESKEDMDKVPAEVKQRFEQLQQRDLPSVVSADDEDENDDADDADEDDGDDEGADMSTQTISIQFVPQNFWTYRTVLI